ncbi:MAG: hypothetical protein GY810_15440 [Aureispira sp.]|nr:hypothetical protein [Aureispira sp.]
MKTILYLLIIILSISACMQQRTTPTTEDPATTNTKSNSSGEDTPLSGLDDKANDKETEAEKLADDTNQPTVATAPTTTDESNEIKGKTKKDKIQKLSKKELEAKTEAQQLFSIEVLAPNEDLPPVKGLYVKLMIRNNHKVPMWYLLPRSANKSLGTSSKLRARTDRSQPFSSRLYKGTINDQNEGQLIEVTMYGDNSRGFKAFYVPPMSSITFRNYEINDGEDVENMELWSATALWVNSKKPLEDWLPYEVLCDANVKIHCTKSTGCDWDNLDWDNSSDAIRKDYPKESVSFIQAKTPKKHYISLKGVEH